MIVGSRSLLAMSLFGCVSMGLAMMSNAQDNTAVTTAVVPPVHVVANQPRAIDPTELLPEKLSIKVTKEFEETSLSDVAAWVQEQTGYNVVLDERKLESDGILPSDPVTDSMAEMPIYMLLDRLARIGVDWRLTQGVIYFEPVGKSEIYAEQYNVGELLDKGYKSDTLIWAIRDTIAQDSWASNGGLGDVVLLGDVMFVRQVSRIHRKLSGFLAALKSPARRVLIDEPQQHSFIQEALNKNTSVKFRGETLISAVQSLSKQVQLDIRLDRIVLKDAKVSERVPVNLELRDQPLRTVLNVMSAQSNLSWLVSDGVLWITTKEKVEGTAKLALFDVRDLCHNTSECTSLQNAIEQQLNPESWQSNGGVGTIEFPISGIMIVSQFENRLDGVLQLLENYRVALLNSKRRISPEEDPEGVETKYYRLPSEVANDLVNCLPMLIPDATWAPNEAPKKLGSILLVRSWDGEDQASTKEGTPAGRQSFSVLVIEQKRKVHAEIRKVLRRIEVGDFSTSDVHASPSGTGMGGMGGGFGGGMF